MSLVAVEVVPYSSDWPVQFIGVAADLRAALVAVPFVSIEHVGSTSVHGLAAKPILDIDIIVTPRHVAAAVAAVVEVGYRHCGDLGIPGREAFVAPDDHPRRHVYVCVEGALSLRNHLAVREILRSRGDLRQEYAKVKLDLAAEPYMDVTTYIARKSAVLQKVLEGSDLTEDERRQILRQNRPSD
jgi:GrpB-like predicted nucleotidyltransferase (UPF0157 family)